MAFDFSSLMTTFLNVMKTTAQDSTSPDDLRRVLTFINEVARVVDQAFSDVLATLIKYKTLRDVDLTPERLEALASELQDLRTRRHYRDAGDICGQLLMLRETYEQSIEPILKRNVVHFDRWGGLFRLLEDREGKVVELVEQSIGSLQDALYRNTGYPGFQSDYYYNRQPKSGASLQDVRAVAWETSSEIEHFLNEIHSLKNSILGLSGKQGLLELVDTDRYKLREAITYMTNYDHSKQVTITNSPGAIANVAEYMANVSNHVNQNIADSEASDEVKNLVKQLTAQVAAVGSSIDPKKAEQMGGDLKTFSDELAKSEPRRAWYELSLNGVKEAALAIGEVGHPIVETVGKLMPLLLSLLP